MSLRVGIDVGGTFTDVVVFDERRGELVAILKYPSNPRNPAAVVENTLRDIEASFGDGVSLIIHGSTVALNTMLEDRGVRIGLLTTRGFRDVYEIGRQWRGDEVFNIFAPAPRMLLTRDRIHEIGERLDAQGKVLAPLHADEVARAVRRLAADEVEAIAVCFLFAYANPVHERAAAEIIRSIAPHVYVSLSHEVNPEWREYERTASTVANAYIGPPVSHYLHELERLSLQRFPRARVLTMKSDGGVGSADMLSSTPIRAVMSGPVAGVIGSRHLGDAKGIEKLISFDVGGTSSDMSIIAGAPSFKSELTVARHPVRTHTVDIETIGAGGGSTASIAAGGVLKVGPQSAGAVPGPACYDRGGCEPTLTDALVTLGHLNPAVLLDGEMPISSARARDAVRRTISEPLGLSLTKAAWGILTVLATNLIMAMRTITVERGYDPREFTLVPFGGMGPTVAGRIAPELGIRRILVPRDPGAFSAYGMLVTDVRQERSTTNIMQLDDASPSDLNAKFRALEQQALGALIGEGFSRKRLTAVRHAGMRYRGQSYEVSVPVSKLRNAADISVLMQGFHSAHQRRYGHMAQNETVEIVNFQVTAIATMRKPKLKKVRSVPRQKPSPEEIRSVFFGTGRPLPTPVYRRQSLAPGARINGPAVIEEKTSTIVIYPKQIAKVDAYLNVEINTSAANPPGNKNWRL
jgi:N-methylhydantoinase A